MCHGTKKLFSSTYSLLTAGVLLALQLLPERRELLPITALRRLLPAAGLYPGELLAGDDAETPEHPGVAAALGMDPLVRQRQNDTFVNVLCQIDLVLAGRQPQNLAVVLLRLVGKTDQQTPLEIDGDAAILQTTVASDEHAAVDGNVEGKLCLGLDEGHGNAALAVLDVHAAESPEKSTADLERKVVGTVFQPFVSNGISFRCIHLNTNSAQSYEKIRHLQRKRRDVFYN